MAVGGTEGLVSGLVQVVRVGTDSDQGGKKKATIALQQVTPPPLPEWLSARNDGLDAGCVLLCCSSSRWTRRSAR